MWLFKCDNLKREGNTRIKRKLWKRMSGSRVELFLVYPKRVHSNWLKTKCLQCCSWWRVSAVKGNLQRQQKHKEVCDVYVQFVKRAMCMETNESPFCWPKQSKYKEKNQQAPQKICLHNFPNAIEGMIWCFLCK